MKITLKKSELATFNSCLSTLVKMSIDWLDYVHYYNVKTLTKKIVNKLFSTVKRNNVTIPITPNEYRTLMRLIDNNTELIFGIPSLECIIMQLVQNDLHQQFTNESHLMKTVLQ